MAWAKAREDMLEFPVPENLEVLLVVLFEWNL